MAQTTSTNLTDQYRFGFHEEENYVFKSEKGLSEAVVKSISGHKEEKPWLTSFRLNALSVFYKKTLPDWGGNLQDLDFNNIFYYIKPTARRAQSWKDLPKEIKNTYDRLGIPEAEKKMLLKSK